MSGDVSPAAEAANRRLYEMRARRVQETSETAERSPHPRQHAATARERGEGRRKTTSHSDESVSPPNLLSLLGSPCAQSPHLPLEAAAQSPTPLPTSAAAQSSGMPAASQQASPSPTKPAGPPTPPRTTTQTLAALAQLPAHLGWGSETLSAHLRRRAKGLPSTLAPLHPFADEKGGRGAGAQGSRGEREQVKGNAPPSTPSPFLLFSPSEQSRVATREDSASTVKIYPSIALGMLREERTAAGRVWLLLRALDAPGRGMVSVAEARAALTSQGSPLRLCGWRRLRQLLAEGEGVFWVREKGRATRPQRSQKTSEVFEDRLRLFGPARVAAALGVRWLVGRPVGVAVAALLGPIGDARAHLYATFHSGRAGGIANYELRITNEESALDSSLVNCQSVGRWESSLGNPVSRDTLTALSGVCARSQAAYERRAGVAARVNIALGERVAADGAPGPAEQERAWQLGRALFRLKDYRGLNGRKGATYLAWRLPNAYGSAPEHKQRPKGRQKRINRQLADLFTKGMTGNGAAAVEKRFYGTAAAAVRGITNYELRITNEEGARHSSFVARRLIGRQGAPLAHWPVGGAGAGGCRVWATVEGVG